MLMKKLIFKTLCVSLVVIFMTACEKEKEDPRDRYVGAYTFSETGSVDFYVEGTLITTIPMNSEGDFVITKDGDGIKLSGENIDDMKGIVNSNEKILFEPASYQGISDGATVTISYVYGPASFDIRGNRLTWETAVVETVEKSNVTATGTGVLVMNAKKK